MLEDYCNTLSDKAQLSIAIWLSKLTLPVWEAYFSENPDKINSVNALVGEANRVKGGASQIDVDFPSRALEKIGRSFGNAQKESKTPIPVMKSDGTLTPLLATSTQFLTNPKWDQTLPYPVRLVFTSVWNILTWLLYKRKTEANETHIYVAINQAADVLMSEKLLSIPQINTILAEFKNEKREVNEDLIWENTPGVPSSKGLTQDEVYKKIIGENIVKDACGDVLAGEILRQMKEEGKTFWDEWEEYYSGTCKIYSFNKEKKSFWRSEVDVIALSFSEEYSMSQAEMIGIISSISLFDLRKSGFEI